MFKKPHKFHKEYYLFQLIGFDCSFMLYKNAVNSLFDLTHEFIKNTRTVINVKRKV